MKKFLTFRTALLYYRIHGGAMQWEPPTKDSPQRWYVGPEVRDALDITRLAMEKGGLSPKEIESEISAHQ